MTRRIINFGITSVGGNWRGTNGRKKQPGLNISQVLDSRWLDNDLNDFEMRFSVDRKISRFWLEASSVRTLWFSSDHKNVKLLHDLKIALPHQAVSIIHKVFAKVWAE